MRKALLLGLVLAGCAEATPAPSIGDRAAAECAKAGLQPAQPAYADCVTRLMTAIVEARGRQMAASAGRPAPVFVPQMPMAQVPQITPTRQPVTCVPGVGGVVRCY